MNPIKLTATQSAALQLDIGEINRLQEVLTLRLQLHQRHRDTIVIDAGLDPKTVSQFHIDGDLLILTPKEG
jgi:hypothetical protein